MRTAITVATLHKGGHRVLSTPDKPLHEQRREFKEFLRLRSHPEFSAVEIYTSGGSGAIRRRLSHPDRAAAIAAANVAAMEKTKKPDEKPTAHAETKPPETKPDEKPTKKKQ